MSVLAYETEQELREFVVMELGLPWWPFTRTPEYEAWLEAHPLTAAGFDPNQPRDPGGEGGGQWVKSPSATAVRDDTRFGDLPLAERKAFMERIKTATAEAARTRVEQVIAYTTSTYVETLREDLAFEEEDGDPNGIAEDLRTELATAEKVEADVMETIHQIHELHDLPKFSDEITVDLEAGHGMGQNWGYHYAEQFLSPDAKVPPKLNSRRIAINPTKMPEDVAGTTAHEFGHYVDVQIGDHSRWFSQTEEGAAWRDAVMRSNAVDTVKRFHRNDPVLVDYLMEPQELWARSYAQWVATRTGNDELLRSVRGVAERLGLPEMQWSDEEFGPIGAAIDEIMREKGLRR